ncbi:MAG: hypothetical protein U9R19_09350 [Bacteroidota bacterium]|nr:hypothetical protein [Bacteroidota bacterium]
MKNLTRKIESISPFSFLKFRKVYLLLLALPLAFSSCYIEKDQPAIGYDGRPGEAYLSLEWEYQEPLYLDAGTSDIPAYFNYGQFYITRPGWYELYYEGEYWNGYGMAWYAWEIEYEIWRNYGSPGGPGYNGRDGADSYLTIILSPYGPFTDRWHKSLSSNNYKALEQSKNRIVVEQIGEEFGIKITYKKVVARQSSVQSRQSSVGSS